MAQVGPSESSIERPAKFPSSSPPLIETIGSEEVPTEADKADP